jgi:hypothetical protein
MNHNDKEKDVPDLAVHIVVDDVTPLECQYRLRVHPRKQKFVWITGT